MSDARDDGSIDRLLTTLDLSSHLPRDTFIPPRRRGGLDTLPRLTVHADRPDADFRPITQLGAGGRGDVFLAQQHALRRDVAIKRLRDRSDGGAELLREARITGGLEHPNVVPVYALGAGEGDEVLLVMKRVEGRPWSALLDEQPATSAEALERDGEVRDVLVRALRCAPPSYPSSVSAELAAICAKAMAKEPAQRFESVHALSEAVRDFERHRHSATLTLEAWRKLEAEASAGPEALAQSRFGFEQALKAWPQNPSAREGLSATLRREVEYELGQRHLERARRAFEALPHPDAGLAARLDALAKALAEEAQAHERLRRLEQELDLEGSTKARNWLLTGFGVLWGIAPGLAGWLNDRGRLTLDAWTMFVAFVPWAVVGLLVLLVFRRRLFPNQASRQLGVGLVVAVSTAGLVRLLAALSQTSVHASLAFELGAYAIISAMAGMFERRFFIVGAMYAFGSIGAAALTPYAFYAVSLTNLLALTPIPLWWDRAK